MLAYLIVDSTMAEAIKACLASIITHPTTSWSSLRRDGAGAEAILIAAPNLVDSGIRDELIAVRRALPHRPIVLVTTFNRENASLLGEIEVEDVVWLDKVRATLVGAADRALLAGPRRRLVSAMTGSRLSPVLRRVIGAVCAALRLRRCV